jgi:hypothetical protein
MLLIVPEWSAHEFSGGCMATTAVAPGTIKVAQNYKPGAGIQVVTGRFLSTDQGRCDFL